jgi:hypothetical protein
MATAQVTTYSTLADWAKLQDPDGSIATVAELLSQKNEILDDMPFIEGNLPTGHRGSVRTSLPTPTWRRINQGIDPTKTTSAQVTDTCGISTALRHRRQGPGRPQRQLRRVARAGEQGLHRGHGPGHGRAAVLRQQHDFSPEKIMGFAPRYNTLTAATSQTANNVVNGGGGASVNTSIWLIGWDNDKVTGIFPKGSMAGLQDDDLGRDWAFDANSKRYRAYMTEYKWKAGLHVRDWRYVARIANLATTNGTAGFTSLGAGRHRRLRRSGDRQDPVPERLPPGALHEPLTKRYFDKQRNYGVNASSTVNLTTIRRTDGGADRGVIQHFDNYAGIPIKICDQILSTEATLT